MRLNIAELSTEVARLNEGRNHHKEGIDAAHTRIRALENDVSMLKEKEALNERVRALAWVVVISCILGSLSLIAMAWASVHDSYYSQDSSSKSHIESSK